MRGVSLCKCKLPVFLYLRCLHKLKLKDDHRIIPNSQPKTNKRNLKVQLSSEEEEEEEKEREKPLDDEKGKEEEEEDGVECEKEAAVILKSSLKKDAVGIVVEKRNVKWMDLVGKDLIQIHEFEPMELEEEEQAIRNTPCLWFIQ